MENQANRFQNALATLRLQGLHAELNTTACCRSCACSDGNGRGVLAYCEKAAWKGDTLMSRQYGGEKVTLLNFNFNFDDLSVARACRKVFRYFGFEVTWNGRPSSCVQVHLI